jgi:hypothetical protein
MKERKNECCGSGINLPDDISESWVTSFGLKILKFLVADLGSSAFLILRDRKFMILDPGSGINISDQQQ